MVKLKSEGKKKPDGSVAPGANWLALKKKLPSSSKSPLMSKHSVKAQSRVPSASFPRGRISSPVPDVVVGSSKIASAEVKALQDMILGKGVAGEALAGEPGRYVAIDCEMVGVGDGSESSLARASIVDFQGRVVLDEFVLQRERVTDYRTRVSGIRPVDMINAKPFSEVQSQISALLSSPDRVLVGHALHNDLSALLLSHPAARIRDTQVYAGRKPILGKGKGKANASEKTLWEKYRSPQIGLKKLVREELDVDIQTGEHSSVTDARAAMAIYRLHKRAWDASLPVSHVKRTKTISGNETESGVVATGEDVDQTQEGKAKRKRRNSAGEFPGGGRRGVSSGLGAIVQTRATRPGKEKSADQGGPKWWQSLGGDKSKGKMTL